MPQISLDKLQCPQYTFSMNYSQVSKEAIRKAERNDCAVRAAAIVTGTEYSVIWDMMRLEGRKPASGTPNYITNKVVCSLGFQLYDYTDLYRKKALTVCTLERVLVKTGTYLIWTRGHILAYKDGKIQDWTRGRRHRVIRVVKVQKCPT